MRKLITIVIMVIFSSIPAASWGISQQVAIQATVLESTSFSVTPPASPINFGSVSPQKYMVSSPVTVNMATNMLPWTVRVYTQNVAYTGSGSAAGMVGISDTAQSVPLKVWCPNYGPAGYTTTPPSITNNTYWTDNWLRIPNIDELTADSSTWRRLAWRNTSQDAGLGNSFNAYVAADFTSAPAQAYQGALVFEILNQ